MIYLVKWKKEEEVYKGLLFLFTSRRHRTRYAFIPWPVRFVLVAGVYSVFGVYGVYSVYSVYRAYIVYSVYSCLLYTLDAGDVEVSVDLGCSRLIKMTNHLSV